MSDFHQPNSTPTSLFRVVFVDRWTRDDGTQREWRHERYYWTQKGAENYGVCGQPLGESESRGRHRTITIEEAPIGEFKQVAPDGG